MTTTTRLPKSGNEWTESDLATYGIKVEYQDIQQFFGEKPLPTPSVPEGILTALTLDDALDFESKRFMSYLKLAIDPIAVAELRECSGKSAFLSFIMVVFDILGYFSYSCGLNEWTALPFLNCGRTMEVRVDAGLIDMDANYSIRLVVHDGLSEGSTNSNAIAQLCAEAIAAFQYNNFRRRMIGLDELDSQVIPGMIMIATSPSFFKIPVSQELAWSIESGQSTSTPTTITGFIPELPHPDRKKDGMRPLDNRRVILQCFEAFKKFVF
ncbi:hypothetical protein BDN70DRAFT_293024 [Pholiota conissans]|uniref:Uncharacterized protein n=1 Tax=Pholiota conissans TaxID=109636 RepID=A0A9P5ZB34_9AGAR|nr:hypothetical protein BDN70DRAFT_293024 [Pholiota conissans]